MGVGLWGGARTVALAGMRWGSSPGGGGAAYPKREAKKPGADRVGLREDHEVQVVSTLAQLGELERQASAAGARKRMGLREELHEVLRQLADRRLTGYWRSRRPSATHMVERVLKVLPFFSDIGAVTLTLVLKLLEVSGHEVAVDRVMAQMRDVFGMEVNVVHVTKILGLYGAQGRLADVEHVFETYGLPLLRRKAYVGREASMLWTSLTKSCIQCARMDRAEHYFALMTDELGLLPDLYTYNVLIWGAAEARRFDMAWKWYEKMRASAVLPNLATFTPIIRALVDAGQVDRVAQVMAELNVLNLVPDRALILQLVDAAACRMEAAEKDSKNGTEVPDLIGEVYRQLQGQGRYAGRMVFTHMIASYFRVGRADAALAMYEEMVRLQVRPDSATLSALVKGLLACGRSVESVLEYMDEYWAHVEVVTSDPYSPIIQHLVRLGRLDDAIEVFSGFCQRGIAPTAYNIGPLFAALRAQRRHSDLVGLYEEHLHNRASLEDWQWQILLRSAVDLQLSSEKLVEFQTSALRDIRSMAPHVSWPVILLNTYLNRRQPDLALHLLSELDSAIAPLSLSASSLVSHPLFMSSCRRLTRFFSKQPSSLEILERILESK